MSPKIILIIILVYFMVILAISCVTSKNAGNYAFFLGNRKSPWYIVAFGMIGASLSGVTFISVPGWVADSQFSYMQMVLGYLLGYFVIANILMPMYYKLNLTSIYTYLEMRFGKFSYKTGASFFLLSRIIGASFRLFLIAGVLQLTIFNEWGVPFFITVFITLLLIWIYTYKGGIKTIIWTDTLQTIFMLCAVVMCFYFISKELNFSISDSFRTISKSNLSKVFFFNDINSQYHFIKQFLSGAFITIVMTGLDQDMMQKNLSCKNIKEAKKNMYWFSITLVPVNFIFLSLGAILIIYANQIGIEIPQQTDDLFPLIATKGFLPQVVGILFIIGLIAAAFSSADSALTSLTTSFTVDILNAGKLEEQKLKKLRIRIHILLSVILTGVILFFKAINDENVISALFRVAGYTYGPLLGLYSFGLFTKFNIKDNWIVPFICILAPIISYVISANSEQWLNGYKFGFELLILNGFITFIGLLLVRKK